MKIFEDPPFKFLDLKGGLFSMTFGSNKPAIAFKPKIGLFTVYHTGIPVTNTANTLTGSSAYINNFVNLVGMAIFEFNR